MAERQAWIRVLPPSPVICKSYKSHWTYKPY